MKTKLCFNIFIIALISILLCFNQDLAAQAFGTPGTQTKVTADEPNNPLKFKPFNRTFIYGFMEYLGTDYDPNQPQNLLIFFHGRGEWGSGSDQSLDDLLAHGYPKILNGLSPTSSLAQKLKNTIVISPQLYANRWWGGNDIKVVIDSLVNYYNVNPNKVYVAGFSAGAAGIESYITESATENYPIVPAAFYFGGHAGQTIGTQFNYLAQDRGFFFYLGGNETGTRFARSKESLENITGVSSGLPNRLAHLPNTPLVSYRIVGNAWVEAQDALVTDNSTGIFAAEPSRGHVSGEAIMQNTVFYDWLFSFERDITINPPPVANAGSDQSIISSLGQVILNGSASTDDQGIATYEWRFIAGPATPVIANANQVSTLVTGLTTPGSYQLELVVTDTGGKQSSDTVIVTVVADNNNTPPVANAGPNQTIVAPQSQATLDGSASTDDQSIVSYQWQYLNKQEIYVNFTKNVANGLASAPWNNFTDFPGTSSTQMNNLLDANNQATSVSVQFVQPWQVHPLNPNPNGTQNGIYPNEVMKHFYFFERETGDTRTIRVSGLSPTQTYAFTLFNGANFADNADKFITRFTVNGVSKELDPEFNINQTVVLENLIPNAQGELDIEIQVVSTLANAAASISALVITAQNNVVITNPDQAITQVTGLTLGTHDFELTVTDAEGEQSNDQVTIEVVDASNAPTTTQINFTLPQVTSAGSTWNETSGNLGAGYQLTNLSDIHGQNQNITMELMDAWSGRKKGGKLVTTPTGPFPNEVREGVYFFQRGTTNNTRQIKFSGLTVGTDYTFTFLSSRTGGGDKTTIFSANGASSTVDASNNIDQYATLANLTPNAQGELTITVSLGASAEYAYLNGIIITAQPVSQSANARKSSIAAPVSSIVAYPNPTSRVLHYKNLEKVHLIFIRDMQGRLIQQVKPASTRQLDISHLQNGLYLLEFVTAQGKQQIKVRVEK